MKKVLLATAVTLGSLVSTTAVNAPAFTGVGDKKIQVGFNGYGYGQGITGTFDYGVHEIVSVGLGAHFYFSPASKYSSNAYLFGFGRANLHLGPLLNLPSQFDIYPGVNLGFFNKGFGWGAHLGLRYFFTPKIGVFGEVGNGGTLGLSFNL